MAELIFLGSGSSTGTPRPFCLMRGPNSDCQACLRSVEGPPELMKNYRCNPSVVIRYLDEENKYVNILIDATKHFRESAVRWFPRCGITAIHAILLSHDHADAVLGLDDVRGLQQFNYGTNSAVPIPIFAARTTMHRLSHVVPYLFKSRPEIAETVELLPVPPELVPSWEELRCILDDMEPWMADSHSPDVPHRNPPAPQPDPGRMGPRCADGGSRFGTAVEVEGAVVAVQADCEAEGRLPASASAPAEAQLGQGLRPKSKPAVVQRLVASLDWRIIQPFGVRIVPATVPAVGRRAKCAPELEQQQQLLLRPRNRKRAV